MAAEHARATSDGAARSRGPETVVVDLSEDPVTNLAELDQLIHGRVRLGIASALAVNEKLSFTELRDILETSDGNLSAHARRLEEGGYLACRKSFDGRIPLTEYRLTDRGRRALERYLDHMEALIQRVREP
ncbi:MAG: transcriptional regulator [Gemmatimonadales bacterium]|nr:MAG: transcriptional regulator [Gemmatimonadales bacterium]